MNRGERAITIDEVPLDWCFQPGVKLDFRHFPDGYVATAADVEAELKRIGHKLSPLEIVVVNTAAGAAYGRPDYVATGCGMGHEATLHLLRQGVRVTGTDVAPTAGAACGKRLLTPGPPARVQCRRRSACWRMPARRDRMRSGERHGLRNGTEPHRHRAGTLAADPRSAPARRHAIGHQTPARVRARDRA